MNAPVLTVTLNPALDVATGTDRLIPQQKLRCAEPRYDAGGGGVNVSRAIAALGGESRAFVALGDSAGARHRAILEESGIACRFWQLEGETRLSLTVMEAATGLHYRFVLPGPPQPPAVADPILAALDGEIATGGHRYVVASGSLPPGIPEDFYGRLAALADRHGARLILDTHGAALRAALPFRPWLIRLNHYEAHELVGGSDPRRSAEILARELFLGRAAEVVVVTLGEAGAIVAAPGLHLRIVAPHVEVLSAVGAGDSFVAALALGLARDWPLEAACRYGVAAAAAAVTTEATRLCERETVERLFAGTVARDEPAGA